MGFANGEIPKLPMNLPLLKGASLVGVFWGGYVSREAARFAEDLRALFDLVAKGRLRPRVSARYPLERGADALADMMNRKVIGKVVITN